MKSFRVLSVTPILAASEDILNSLKVENEAFFILWGYQQHGIHERVTHTHRAVINRVFIFLLLILIWFNSTKLLIEATSQLIFFFFGILILCLANLQNSLNTFWISVNKFYFYYFTGFCTETILPSVNKDSFTSSLVICMPLGFFPPSMSRTYNIEWKW